MAKIIPTKSATSSADQKVPISTVLFGSILSVISLYVMYMFFGIFILAAQYLVPGLQTGALINLILLIEWIGMIYLNVKVMTNLLKTRKAAITATVGGLLIIGGIAALTMGAMPRG